MVSYGKITVNDKVPVWEEMTAVQFKIQNYSAFTRGTKESMKTWKTARKTF